MPRRRELAPHNRTDPAREYAYARAAWALRTGQPLSEYDNLTDTDLEAFADALADLRM